MTDSINNISALTQAAPATKADRTRILSAIKTASDKTGVDFTYLLKKAAQESSLNPQAKAARSSATGLFQFIDQTWLKTVKENGADYGLGEVADKISIGSDGVARVASEADKKAILALRKNPEVSALMAAELAKDNKESLQKTVGGKVGATEMYLAHFLGSNGASELLEQIKANPSAKAADVLPSAAAANKGVFYDDATGEAKSVAQVYQQFAQKFDKSSNLKAFGIDPAEVSGATSNTRVADATSTTDDEMLALARSMALADASAYAAGSGGSTFSVGGMSLNNATPSPFATMILAQMDMESFALDAKESMGKYGLTSDGDRRKSTLSALASVG